MQIYDISLTISSDLPTWPGDPAIRIERFSKMEEGDLNNVSLINMGAHVGTHIDAPYHFVQDGMRVDAVDLDVLVGPVQVVRIPDEVGAITAEVIRGAGISPETQRVLFKTRNSALWVRGEKRFQEDFVAVDAGGARLLVEMGMKLVGLDYLSVAPYQDPIPTHQILLSAGVVLLENADLSRVSPGNYTLYCLPLKLGGAEGAPARAILMA